MELAINGRIHLQRWARKEWVLPHRAIYTAVRNVRVDGRATLAQLHILDDDAVRVGQQGHINARTSALSRWATV